MKKTLNKWFLTVVAIAVLTLSFSPFAMAADSQIQIFVENEPFVVPVKPIVEQGALLLPFRALFERFGFGIEYNGKTKTIKGSNETIEIELNIGKKTAKVNGANVTLNAAPKAVAGNTYIPLRFIGESLGYEVLWDGEFKLVSIAPAKEQALLPVLLQLAAINEKNVKSAEWTLDKQTPDFQKWNETQQQELNKGVTFEIEDIGVLEFVDNQADVGVSLTRLNAGDTADKAVAQTFTYKLNKQKNGVWRIASWTLEVDTP